MVMSPEVAVAGTLNESVFGEMVPNVTTAPPPTVTSGCGDFSFKPAPLMVTRVLGVPELGEKLKIVGNILKLVGDDAGVNTVPDGDDTTIWAVDALVGTVALIVLLSTTVKPSALALPNATLDAAIKFVPLMTILVFGRPLAGEKLVIAGAAKKLVAVEMTLVAVLKL